MKETNDKGFADNKCFRCKKNVPKHDIKYSIRKESIFENIKINLIAIYFLIYECFVINLSSNKSYNEYTKFNQYIDSGNVSKNNIGKLFSVLRNKIKIKMHAIWKKNHLGNDISVGAVPRLEKDESKLIGNESKVYWMFAIICRETKKCRIFCVCDNRSRESLLPIIKENVDTYNDLNEYNSLEDIHKYSLCTRIYSDCWSAYQLSDFMDCGFLLHRVNHSLWLGSGLFHTNTVEGLWGQIKRLCNDFSGITFNLLDKVEKTGINPRDYLDDWICWAIFLRDCELNKLNKINKILKINEYLKID